MSAAFDRKLPALEQENLKTVYGFEYDLYHPRLTQWDQSSKKRLNAVSALCTLDFVAG